MRIGGLGQGSGEIGQVHLGYCTNIHSGETLSEVRDALVSVTSRVREGFTPDTALGIGLRLSNVAVSELRMGTACAEFEELLSRLGLYVFTINGFPYGTFHGATVKERVYDPDWTTRRRVEYTLDLVHVLSELMPDGEMASISTVPGCFRPKDSPKVRTQIVGHLVEVAAQLWDLHSKTGREICIALEPEPHCMLETTTEAITFFSQCFGPEAVALMAGRTGLSAKAARAALMRHIGLCLDACHAAVEFEESEQAVLALQKAGIRIAKLQISCGLLIEQMDAQSRSELTAYADPVYLHQTVVKQGDQLRRYLDLPEALEDEEPPDLAQFPPAEWRVHYHVPVFLEQLGAFKSTQGHLRALLQLQKAAPYTSHLEVETYTWDVLPPKLRASTLDTAIVRELNWALNLLRTPD
jgi:sugar phosphate isomerase/epimerase